MPTSDDANDSTLQSDALDDDGELTADTLEKVVGGATSRNLTGPTH